MQNATVFIEYSSVLDGSQDVFEHLATLPHVQRVAMRSLIQTSFGPSMVMSLEEVRDRASSARSA